MLKIKRFKEGFDNETYVGLFNTVFVDYDDVRKMTVEELKRLEHSPSYNSEGTLIAEWNGEPVGMVDAYIDKFRDDGKGFIQSLCVLPQYRRKGIARQLVKDALQSLKERGTKIAETWAQTDKQACISLYESFGFSQIRTTSMMKRSLDGIPEMIGENLAITMRNADVEDEEDIKLLNRLDNESFKEHFNFRPRTLEETEYSLFESPWFRVQGWFFATQNDQCIGYVGIGVDEELNKEKNRKWGWILDIGVLKSFRRQGVGTRLMLHSMRLLKEIEMKDALLYVDDMNPTKAISLYEKVGLKVARRNIVYQLNLTT